MTDFNDLEKQKAAIDWEYLGWIRKKGCTYCGKVSHVHHLDTIGMGGKRGENQKGSDYSAIPLCIHHHNLFHKHGTEWVEGKDKGKRSVWYIAWKLLEEWHVIKREKRTRQIQKAFESKE